MPSEDLFSFRTVTSEEVRRVISSLPLNKSRGPDKINSRILKDCLPVILGPLTNIINCSLTTCTFPTAWKVAEVIPIVKDGDHEVASNNRPISLLAIGRLGKFTFQFTRINSTLSDPLPITHGVPQG